MRLLHRPQVLDEAGYDDYARGNLFPTEQEVLRKRNKAQFPGINMAALAYAASEALGGCSVPAIKVIGPSSFNDVLLLTYPDGSEVVARIPVPRFRIPGRIPSVVATMTFARHVLKIPCPEVYAWNDSDRTIVGAPYILMERAHGALPWRVENWNYDEGKQLKILDSISRTHAQLAQPLAFSPNIGSICFNVDAFPDGPVGPSDVDYSSPAIYLLGPFSRSATVGVDSFNINNTSKPQNSLKAFWDELISAELSASLQRWPQGHRDMDITPNPREIDYLLSDRESKTCALGDVLDAGENLRTLASSCILPQDKDLMASCLVSSDFAYRNILIDPETLEVSAILDWDDYSVMPFVLCTRVPDEICDCPWASAAWQEEVGRFPFVPCEEPPPSDLHIPEEEGQQMIDYEQRRFYKERIALYDRRFSRKGFWALREDPLKIQYLVTHGWVHWLSKDDWLKRKVVRLKSNHEKVWSAL